MRDHHTTPNLACQYFIITSLLPKNLLLFQSPNNNDICMSELRPIIAQKHLQKGGSVYVCECVPSFKRVVVNIKKI